MEEEFFIGQTIRDFKEFGLMENNKDKELLLLQMDRKKRVYGNLGIELNGFKKKIRIKILIYI